MPLTLEQQQTFDKLDEAARLYDDPESRRDPHPHHPRSRIPPGEPVTRRRSLRTQLLWWLLVPLGLLCLAGAAAAWFTVRDAIYAAYDKTLSAAALDIADHLRMVGTRPEIDLPPVALEMLDTVDQDRVFYSVSWRSSQGDAFMTGYEDLPRPPDSVPGKAIF